MDSNGENTMKRISFLRVGMMALFLAACRDGDSTIVETSVPPGAARITLTQMSATGTRVTNVTTTVDSVNSRFETVTCVAEGTSACPITDRQSGDANEAAIGQLFALTHTESFRALHDEYKSGGDDSPPDGGWTILTVRTGSLEKTVRWETNYPIPNILARPLCWINSIRGSLALCA
jgi:hypothetical protein